jgi:hypothetical protein
MSRGQWLAYSCTMAALGCSGPEALPVNGDATSEAASHVRALGSDAAEGAEGEANDDAIFDGADLDATPSVESDARFVCVPAGFSGDAAVVCDPDTQYCHWHSGNGDQASCYKLPNQCLTNPPAIEASACEFVASCDGGLRCSCIDLDAGHLPESLGGCWGCRDNEPAGVTLSCGSCYGAPPPRRSTDRRA